MTWAQHAQRGVRTPAMLVEIDLDYYEDAGDAVAAVNDDGSLCYRTPATTSQAADDFTLTTRTRRFLTHTQRPIPELGAIPCLRSAKIAAEEAKIGKGLGFFGQATIELQDFVDNDRREDPFPDHASRAAIDASAGTYFGKLMARNPFWTGRAIRVYEGWATDGEWHTDDAIEHKYFVRDVQGPSGGRLRITAAGPLQLLGLSEKEAPAPSAGRLLADISPVDVTAALDDATFAEDYTADGFVRIGDEVMTFERTGTALAIGQRGQFGTTAADHSAGDTVQLCVRYVAQPLVDIIQDLLTTYGGIDASLLALDEWASESATFFALYDLTATISKPTKVLALVQELLEAAGAIQWWDDDLGLVRLRAIRPAATVLGTWSDRFHLLGAPNINRDMAARVSRCDVALDLRSADKDPSKLESYRVRVVGQELGAEATAHGSSQVRVITSQWLSSAQTDLAIRASFQVAAQLRDGRQTYVVEVAAKDAARQIGDNLRLLTRDLVDRTGQATATRCIVIKREALVPGSRYRYTLERVPFDGRFAFYVDPSTPDYDDAEEFQRDPGGFYANADGGGFEPDAPYVYA